MNGPYSELLEKVKSYDRNTDVGLLEKACRFSEEAHASQRRASGDPYFSHPFSVACILCDMKLDAASIITGLLHDVLEDTLKTGEEIKENFGSEVLALVRGVTKLNKIGLQSEHASQGENFRKLVLAMSSDIRVLLVKLADRLHNMRTLQHVSSVEKRKRIALETLEIYAPLAERMGMQEMKVELEELSFMELYPEERQSILARLALFYDQGKGLVDKIVKELEDILKNHQIEGIVVGRKKTTYSIWQKIKRKNVNLDQLVDIMAFRIIVNSIPEVYTVLGLIHTTYAMIPGRFKDYISCPKTNKYQSIHTTIVGPYQHRIEVQIRTHEMDYVAELGVAAHWEYKEGIVSSDTRQYRWLRGLLDILEHSSGPEEFLEHTKLEMFQDQVFCFTPKGDVISLPNGATPIDFAYAVHSEVGDRCIGAKVNGSHVSLKSLLQNGDQVEITTSPSHKPLPIWERYAVTGKARARVRRHLRTEEKSQSINLGRSILKELFEKECLVYNESLIKSFLEDLGFPSFEDLCASIGSGEVRAINILYNLYPDHQFSSEEEKVSSGIPIKGLIPGIGLHFADCCCPIPEDLIKGEITKGVGLIVHRAGCDVIQQEDKKEDFPLSWDQYPTFGEGYKSRICLDLSNEPGALGAAAFLIGRYKVNIINLEILEQVGSRVRIRVDIQVQGLSHLEALLMALQSHPMIFHAERIYSLSENREAL